VGERLAILRDVASDSFDKEGLIVKPEQYKRAPLSGVIVCLGNKVKEEDGYYVGQAVNFNKFNVIEFQLDLDGHDGPISLDVLSVLDIYWEDLK